MKGKRWKRQQLAASALCLYRPEKQPTGGKSGDNSLLGFCAIMIKEKENWEWITRPYDSELVSRLAQQTGVEPIVVQTLVGRKVVNPRDIVSRRQVSLAVFILPIVFRAVNARRKTLRTRFARVKRSSFTAITTSTA